MKDMSPINGKSNSPFENIKRHDENGKEYWDARELMPLLGYSKWSNFKGVVKKAEIACKNSKAIVQNHFADVGKMVDIGSNANRQISNYYLSRYACYLIAQNGDSSKEEISNAQTYFAIQTRKQELFDSLGEEEKRLKLRNGLKDHNAKLAAAAKDAGVCEPIDFAIFQDKGYRGLYGGLGAKDIARRKGLKGKAPILDHMGSTELAANLFRATQTEDALKRDKVSNKERANQTHFKIGKKVRNAIEDIGGTMPEDLPPAENIKVIERKHKKLLKEE